MMTQLILWLMLIPFTTKLIRDHFLAGHYEALD